MISENYRVSYVQSCPKEKTWQILASSKHQSYPPSANARNAHAARNAHRETNKRTKEEDTRSSNVCFTPVEKRPGHERPRTWKEETTRRPAKGANPTFQIIWRFHRHLTFRQLLGGKIHFLNDGLSRGSTITK